MKKGYTKNIVQVMANLLINLSKIVPLGCFGKRYNGYNGDIAHLFKQAQGTIPATFWTQMPYFKHNV